MRAGQNPLFVVRPWVHKVFVTDGDPLAMDLVEKAPSELSRLRELGLTHLYIGPDSGDDKVLDAALDGSVPLRQERMRGL